MRGHAHSIARRLERATRGLAQLRIILDQQNGLIPAGLAWAFFAAGTPATVVSLWPLESGSATTLTLAFHRRLRASLGRQHESVADSLRQAALEVRREPRYSHPFYWAGLVAVGDGY